MNNHLSFDKTTERHGRICETLLGDEALLAAATAEGLRKQDLRAVVDHAQSARDCNQAQGGAAGQASGSGASGQVEDLMGAYGAARARARLAEADAQESLLVHPSKKLAQDLAALAGARFATRAAPRKKKAPPPPDGSAPAPADPPRQLHFSRAADALVAEVNQWAKALGKLDRLKPFLKARGLDGKALDRLREQAKAIEVQKGESISLHAAAHLATAAEHDAVAEAHRAWAKVSPSLHRVARANAQMAALLSS